MNKAGAKTQPVEEKELFFLIYIYIVTVCAAPPKAKNSARNALWEVCLSAEREGRCTICFKVYFRKQERM